LRLEDNKITDKGISYFAKALQREVQDIIVLLNRLDKHSKMFLGDRQEKLAEMNRILKITEENGVNTKTIVMEKSLKNVTISEFVPHTYSMIVNNIDYGKKKKTKSEYSFIDLQRLVEQFRLDIEFNESLNSLTKKFVFLCVKETYLR
jgi:hypothetical protein